MCEIRFKLNIANRMREINNGSKSLLQRYEDLCKRDVKTLAEMISINKEKLEIMKDMDRYAKEVDELVKAHNMELLRRIEGR